MTLSDVFVLCVYLYAVLGFTENLNKMKSCRRHGTVVVFLSVAPYPHTWRTWSTVEGTHGIQTLHQWSSGAATVIGQTFIHILTAVAIALPAWETTEEYIFRKNLHFLCFYKVCVLICISFLESCAETKTNGKAVWLLVCGMMKKYYKIWQEAFTTILKWLVLNTYHPARQYSVLTVIY